VVAVRAGGRVTLASAAGFTRIGLADVPGIRLVATGDR
jgi:hypothetical protein